MIVPPPRSPLFPYTTLFRSPDGLPYVGPHRRYPRHLFALGYGGNGMTFGFLAARLVLEEYLGKAPRDLRLLDRKSTRLNSSHPSISYAVFCLKKTNATSKCP